MSAISDRGNVAAPAGAMAAVAQAAVVVRPADGYDAHRRRHGLRPPALEFGRFVAVRAAAARPVVPPFSARPGRFPDARPRPSPGEVGVACRGRSSLSYSPFDQSYSGELRESASWEYPRDGSRDRPRGIGAATTR